MRDDARNQRTPASKEPGLEHERALAEQGYRLIAGVDEAGRGAWAGPVYAAAALLPMERPDLLCALDGVKDSKLLSPRRRETLLDVVSQVALSVGVGNASAAEIDALGIVAATRLAMARALEMLSPSPQALIIDYIPLPNIALPQRALPKADQRCLSVAAASIVAKVSRDRWMIELDAQYPGYGFARHKGYGTVAHRCALAELGPSPIHRMSWAPLRATPEQPTL
jgi:ribonuclease HII